MATAEILAVISAETIGAAGGLWIARHAVTAAMRRYGMALIFVCAAAIFAAVLSAGELSMRSTVNQKSPAVRWVEEFERAERESGPQPEGAWPVTLIQHGREVTLWQRNEPAE